MTKVFWLELKPWKHSKHNQYRWQRQSASSGSFYDDFLDAKLVLKSKRVDERSAYYLYGQKRLRTNRKTTGNNVRLQGRCAAMWLSWRCSDPSRVDARFPDASRPTPLGVSNSVVAIYGATLPSFFASSVFNARWLQTSHDFRLWFGLAPEMPVVFSPSILEI